MEFAHSRDARTRLQTAPPHSVLIPVLGIPVRFEAEEPGAITAVSDAFAA